MFCVLSLFSLLSYIFASLSLSAFLFVLGFLSSPLSFVELASIMAEFSSYCWSCDRNSVGWLSPMLGTGEVSGAVMVDGQ